MTCIQATTKMGIEVTTTGICGVKGEIGQELFVPLQVWVVFEHKQPKIKGFPWKLEPQPKTKSQANQAQYWC